MSGRVLRVALPGGLPIGLALAGVLLAAALAFARADIRTDMLSLLPTGESAAARLMLAEAGGGPAARMILAGIDGAPPARLAAISAAMGAALRGTGPFEDVRNGPGAETGGPEAAFLFGHRYLLSPAVDADAFAEPALRAAMRNVLRALRSSAAPLASQFGLADPQGAFLPVAGAWIGANQVRLRGGVWFAPDAADEPPRAVMLLMTRAGGMDVAGQDASVAAIRAAFAAAEPGSARLVLGGPAVFAQEAAQSIRSDALLVSIGSVVLVVALLLWRFRSPWAIAAALVPVALGVAAGLAAVQAVFGFVHGVALGFGMTMLGVTADYPVLLIGHRKQGEAPPATLRRIGRAFALAVAAALLGLTGMLFSGLAGLAQIGLFAAAGLAAAAVGTRFLLPSLIVAADLAPVPLPGPARLLRVERLRAWRAWALLPAGAAALFLAVLGGPRIEHDLVALSPVPAAALADDAALRAAIGAPDAGLVGVVRGATEQAVLEREEALLPALDRLRAEGAIGGAEAAARLLPSIAVQRARRAALPDDAELAARVEAASEGLGFRADAFAPFLRDVAAVRTAPPLTPEDVSPPLLRARLAALLPHDGAGWFGLILPADVRDPARFAAAMRDGGAEPLDMGGEANALVAHVTESAWRWLGIGAAAALAALLIGLRDARMTARVTAAVAGAVVVTLALLTFAGVRLTLLHIVALQFVCGIGLDYALFFARRRLDAEERARTLMTLFLCNAMTVGSFAMLALCRTPILRQIGATVAVGALAALVLSFLLTGAAESEA